MIKTPLQAGPHPEGASTPLSPEPLPQPEGQEQPTLPAVSTAALPWPRGLNSSGGGAELQGGCGDLRVAMGALGWLWGPWGGHGDCGVAVEASGWLWGPLPGILSQWLEPLPCPKGSPECVCLCVSHLRPHHASFWGRGAVRGPAPLDGASFPPCPVSFPDLQNISWEHSCWQAQPQTV